MKRKLAMDDIREGMYITILKGKTEKRIVPGPDGPMTVEREKDQYKGSVLEVTAIEMPYMVIKVHDSRGSRTDSIDMRNIQVMTIGPKFILARFPDFQFNEDSFWEEIRDETLEDDDATIKAIFEDL